MANTRDTMGEQACLDALIAGTITEFEDDEVYELRDYAFAGIGTIESVSLPSCKEVGSYAFSGCDALTSITLGYNSVVSKGSNAIPSQFNSSGAGTIYVPASQLAAYQSSSSWSGYNLAAIPA